MGIRVDTFYLGCLAHASYLVSSEGVAAVIDPQRDVDIYIEAAAKEGLKIEHVIETHLHADFVSGHHELAQRTGATIYLGEGSGAGFAHAAVKDGDVVEFGRCRLEFLQTPGHTIESVCVVLTDLDAADRPQAVFTGDTLFVGDVGRPDLSPNHTPQQLAALLHQSLTEKLLKLPDDVEVLPAHGAGSLCGRQMGPERSSTIGRERRFNYALQVGSRDEFISLLTDSLPAKPEYFQRDVELNRRGAAPIRDLPPLTALSAAEVLRLQSKGAVVLDTRPVMQFAAAHVPGSLHIALTGQYASWAARVLGLDSRVIIAGEDIEQVRESQLRLARVGIEDVAGYLEDGVLGWIRGGLALDYIPQITAQELVELQESDGGTIALLDVREPAETSAGVLSNAVTIPLGDLAARVDELDRGKLLVIYCKGGYRSSIATSILRRAGFSDIANLSGGFDGWRAAGMAVAEAPIPSEPHELQRGPTGA